jgi:hypothetical protein
MLSEVECNTFIKNSLTWSHKIGDSNGITRGKTQKRPFDGFGTYKGVPVYWESKYYHITPLRITFKDLFPRKHQVENLIAIYKDLASKGTSCWAAYCLFIRYGARKVRLYILKNNELETLYFSKCTHFTLDDISKASSSISHLSTNLGKEHHPIWDTREELK